MNLFIQVIIYKKLDFTSKIVVKITYTKTLEFDKINIVYASKQ